MGYNPLDWNRDGRVGMGDGAITEMLVDKLSEGGGVSRESGGCGCGCLLAALSVVFALIYIVATLGGS